MDAYLYVNRDGTELMSSNLTLDKTGLEVIENVDGTFHEITYRLRNGVLSSGAYLNRFGELLPEYFEDTVSSLSASPVGNEAIDERLFYSLLDVSDKFPPTVDKLTKWDTCSMDRYIVLPKGTIKKLIGKELTFDDEPYKITDKKI